jgi:hypothetical protein
MRDFMKKEVVFYNIFNKLESIFIPSLETKVAFLYVLKMYISDRDKSVINQFTGLNFFYLHTEVVNFKGGKVLYKICCILA